MGGGEPQAWAPDDCPTPGLSELASGPHAQAAWKTGLSPWVEGGRSGGGTQRRACGEDARRGNGQQGWGAGGAPWDGPPELAPVCPFTPGLQHLPVQHPRDHPALTASS